MIIGLTGLNGSGKGVVADYLVKKKGFIYHSHSDAVREEVLKNNAAITRDKLIITANTLRKMYGPAVLADRLIKKIDFAKNTVVDSFRNPAEIRAFKKRKNYTLWCVSASQETRFQRVKERKRENDPQTMEEFVRMENKELVSSNPSHQNLLACQDRADTILSNDGSLDDLHKRIEVLLKELKNEKK